MPTKDKPLSPFEQRIVNNYHALFQRELKVRLESDLIQRTLASLLEEATKRQEAGLLPKPVVLAMYRTGHKIMEEVTSIAQAILTLPRMPRPRRRKKSKHHRG